MTASFIEDVSVHRHHVSRRRFLHTVSAASFAAGTLSFRDALSLKAEELRQEGRSMIVLWMGGAPSQMETFDPKPNHENGGETKTIKTSVPGIEIAEGWDGVAKVMDECAIIRSMTNKEGNHRRATYQLHTGYAPAGSVKHPNLSANIAKEIADPSLEIPSIVSVGQNRVSETGGGFLGIDYEPFVVSRPGEPPSNAAPTVTNDRYKKRLQLLGKLEKNFSKRGGETVVDNHQRIYNKASKMILSPKLKAFDLEQESDETRDNYGRNTFGDGCLLARRLVENGVTCVEVRSGNWDMHTDLYDRMSNNSAQVGPAMGALISDLKQRGMLDKTLVVWMGEFGRTPKLNARGGRDHYPRVFNALMAGGGVKGGQVIGSSTDDGTAVKDRPVQVNDLLRSICHSMKVDPTIENISPLGRPLKIVDDGEVVKELFT